ncbi:PREDICTED: JNK-interacting protein 1-like [Priapulus caudatus]|uniref:JNK-interacting protein 1-like n=1 Tax=Priapulus caudatus TaxID=37621 RepID=A0ABM1DXK6_PRICU|nr:PREDICTED: JNK-interacting protein 1-like [Priapulus caudatus]
MADPQFDSFRPTFGSNQQFIDIQRNVYKLTHDLSLDEISSYIEVDDDPNAYEKEMRPVARVEDYIGVKDLNVLEEKTREMLTENETRSETANHAADNYSYENDNRFVERKNKKNNGLQHCAPMCWPPKIKDAAMPKVRSSSSLSTSSDEGLEASPKMTKERRSTRRDVMANQFSLADELQMAGCATWSPKGKTLKLRLQNSDLHQSYLHADNKLLCEDSSPDEKPQWMHRRRSRHTSQSSSSPSPRHDSSEYSGDVSTCSIASVSLSGLKATHRGLYRFVPRHSDEVEIEIGDLILVEKEDDDLWCTGVNFRTEKKGIFPFAYAVDLEYSLDPDANTPAPAKTDTENFPLKFLGSVGVSCHKGNQVLCQAITKIAQTRKNLPGAPPAPYCILEVSQHGLRMVDKMGQDSRLDGSTAAERLKFKLERMFGKQRGGQQLMCEEPHHDHFFSLKNISFCGYHPKNHRYFGFITKHPTESRFACHVYLGDGTTKPVAEAIGRAFQRFYQEYRVYMAQSHPTVDIYMD